MTSSVIDGSGHCPSARSSVERYAQKRSNMLASFAQDTLPLGFDARST